MAHPPRSSAMPTAPDPLGRAPIVRLVDDATEVRGARAAVLSPRSTLLESDVLLAGKYRLEVPLGEGAMGKVWLARHEAMGRRVALKVLHRAAHADVELRERFEREVEAVAALDHPGIVTAFDCGRLGDGRTFLAMEYVEGRSLEQVLRSRRRLPWPDVRRVAKDVFEALAYVHDRGFVHRDLKPANLLLCGGDAKLGTRILDLGIARRTDRLHGSTLTQAGEFIGTPAYSSPEQLRGDRVGPAADLFSAGALLYRAVTGEPPFAGRTFGEVTQSQHAGPASPPVLLHPDPARPAAFDALLLSLLSRDPSGRPSSAREVCARLASLDEERPASAPPSAALGLALGAALGLGLVAGGLAAALLLHI